MKGAMSRQALLVIILAVLSAWSVAMSAETSTPAEFVNTLMPQPSQLAAQEGRLIITSSFTATADQFRDPRLDAAVTRVLDRLRMHTAIAIATPPNASTSVKANSTPAKGRDILNVPWEMAGTGTESSPLPFAPSTRTRT